MSKQSIGYRLKELRQTANLTQRALAEKIGISPAAIGRLESEGDYVTSRPTIIALAQVFHCDPDWLETGRETKVEGPKNPTEAVEKKALLASDVPPWGKQLEEDTQMTAAIHMICRRLTSQQLAQLAQEVIKSPSMTEKVKVFWVKIFSQWLITRMDLEEFEKLTPKQKVAARRAENYRQRADPSAAREAS